MIALTIKRMDENNGGIVSEGLKYLGYLFVGLLTMLFGWIFKLIGDWMKKKAEAYVSRLEKAADRIDEAVKSIDELKKSDQEIIRRLDEAETRQKEHAEVQRKQGEDIKRIKDHLNLD